MSAEQCSMISRRAHTYLCQQEYIVYSWYQYKSMYLLRANAPVNMKPHYSPPGQPGGKLPCQMPLCRDQILCQISLLSRLPSKYHCPTLADHYILALYLYNSDLNLTGSCQMPYPGGSASYQSPCQTPSSTREGDSGGFD